MFKYNSTNLMVQFYTEMNWFMVRKSPQFFTEGFFDFENENEKTIYFSPSFRLFVCAKRFPSDYKVRRN